MTVARENFLDKLKREREEAAAAAANSNQPKVQPSFPEPLRAKLPTLPRIATTTTTADSSSEEDDVVVEEVKPKPLVRQQIKQARLDLPEVEVDESGNLLLRKRSKAYLENGKIKIAAASNAQVLHVIERKQAAKKDVKHFDDRAKEADKKRLESLGKMKDAYNQQKIAIKQALGKKVEAPLNRKIVFDAPAERAEEVVEETVVKKSKPAVKATGLFDEDDEEEAPDDYSKDFQVKEHYEGADGARLLRLQSRFKNDERFKMNAKFLEGNGETAPAWEPSVEADGDGEEEGGGDDDERKWQYGILESVMGKKIQQEPTAKQLK